MPLSPEEALEYPSVLNQCYYIAATIDYHLARDYIGQAAIRIQLSNILEVTDKEIVIITSWYMERGWENVTIEYEEESDYICIRMKVPAGKKYNPHFLSSQQIDQRLEDLRRTLDPHLFEFLDEYLGRTKENSEKKPKTLEEEVDPEDDYGYPPHLLPYLRYAFGTKKTITDWSRDPRCIVRLGTLKSRVRNGWSIEEAMTTTLLVTPRKKPKPQRTAFQTLTAWGEEKTFSEWEEDERCKSNNSAIRQRVRVLGWTPEEAISTPIGKKHTHHHCMG